MVVWVYLLLCQAFICFLMSILFFCFKKNLNNLRFQTREDDTFSFSNSLGYYFFVGFFYLAGLAIYVAQCPERFKPGKFDIWVINKIKSTNDLSIYLNKC